MRALESGKTATSGARDRRATQEPTRTRTPMTREAIPFVVPDLSQFARTLGRSLKERHASKTEPPGHVELLNLLARAGGHRNLQSLRAAALKAPPAAVDDDTP